MRRGLRLGTFWQRKPAVKLGPHLTSRFPVNVKAQVVARQRRPRVPVLGRPSCTPREPLLQFAAVSQKRIRQRSEQQLSWSMMQHHAAPVLFVQQRLRRPWALPRWLCMAHRRCRQCPWGCKTARSNVHRVHCQVCQHADDGVRGTSPKRREHGR